MSYPWPEWTTTEWAQRIADMKRRQPKALHAHLVKAAPNLDLSSLPALRRLADEMAPALRKAFLAAVKQVRNAIDLEKLAAAIEANSLTAAEAAVQLNQFAERYGALAAPLKDGFRAAARYEIAEISRAGAQGAFDLINPRAVAYAKTAVSKIVPPLKEDAKALIQQFIGKAVSGETTPAGAARDIRDLIGLDPERVKRADAFWQRLMEQGVPEADIDRRVGKYMDALLRERAEVIALTETHRAAQAGELAAWDAAAKEGLFDPADYVKLWVTAPDERLCPDCEEMDGLSVELDEPYEGPDGSVRLNVFGEEMQVPDMHPRCRCTKMRVRKNELSEWEERLAERRADEE